MIRVFHKSREHPIIRDEYGRSARRRAFALFSKEYRPAQIFKENLIPVSMRTLLRYFEDWKKERGRVSYSILKRSMKERPEFSQKYVKILAKYFGVSEEEIILRMQKPWGIIELSKGELPDNRLYSIQSETEERLEAALRLIFLGERFYKNSPEQVKQLIWDILKLKNNTRLVIERAQGQVLIRKEKLQKRS